MGADSNAIARVGDPRDDRHDVVGREVGEDCGERDRGGMAGEALILPPPRLTVGEVVILESGKHGNVPVIG